MARSVARHSRAVQTFYLTLPEDYEEGGGYEWSDFLEDVRNVVTERFPSFTECNRWDGRETRVILENNCAEIGVSEYCGLVAICLAPIVNDYQNKEAFYERWCERLNFKEHLAKRYPEHGLSYAGSASNGEAFFVPINRPNGMVTSKEGVLW